MSLLEHDFGGGVAKGTSHRLEDSIWSVQVLCDTEIGEDQRRVFCFGEI